MLIWDKINKLAGLSRSVVGLQVTSEAAYAVALERRGENIRLVHTCVQDFHKEGFLDDLDFAEHLPGWLAENGLQEADVVLGIPQDVTTVQILEFPPHSHNSLDSMVALQTAQLAELSEDSFTYDYAVMPPSPDHPVPVLVGVCLETFIQDRLDHYNKPGVNLTDLGMDSVGLVNAAVALKPEILKETQPQLILDVGPESTTVIILARGRVHYAGWLNIGVTHYHSALAEKYQVDLEQLRNRPEHYRITQNDSRAHDPLAQTNRLFMNELHAAFEQWQDQTEEEVKPGDLARIYLTGSGANLSGFTAFLEQAVGAEVEILKLTYPVTDADPAEFSVAYGLALQGLDAGLLNVSLAPRQIRWIARRKQRTGILATASVLFMMLLAITLLWNFVRLKERERVLEKHYIELRKCQTIISDLEQTIARLSLLEKVQIPLIENGNRARRFANALSRLSEVRGENDWFIYLADSHSFEAGKQLPLTGTSTRRTPASAVDDDSPPGQFMSFAPPSGKSDTREKNMKRTGRLVDEIIPLKSMIAAGYTRLRPDDPLKPVIEMVQRLNDTTIFADVDWLQASNLDGREDIFNPWQTFLFRIREQADQQFKDFTLQLPFAQTDIVAEEKQ